MTRIPPLAYLLLPIRQRVGSRSVCRRRSPASWSSSASCSPTAAIWRTRWSTAPPGRTFSVIAQYFGTHRLSFILVRLARGILRAVALERVLLARAARGRDLVRYTLEDYRPRRPAKKPQQKKPRPPPRPDPDASLDFDHLPSIEDLEKEIRRRPIGQTLVAICCDLGVGFSLCDGNFSFDLQRAIHGHRGNYTKYYRTIRGREVEFEKEQDRDRTVRFDLPERNRDRVKAILGFFIGEEPVCPFPLPLVAVPEALAARPP